MLYAILAYHEEGVVESWTKEEDAALVAELLQVNDRLIREKSLGPAARLDATRRAVTLRGKGSGVITDGPFAETKEQLLGFYVVDFPTSTVAGSATANPTVPPFATLARAPLMGFVTAKAPVGEM